MGDMAQRQRIWASTAGLTRRLVTATAAVVVATACSGPADPDGNPSRGAREAVEDYVHALNARSADGLMSVGGVEDADWSRQEAERVLAERGGRGWTVEEMRIAHDLGPNIASVRFLAEDASGRTMRDTFTLTRENGTWRVALFIGRPAEPGKHPAATREPGS
ncbi:hypothetical protein GCM10010267_53880 [Streptomyces griseorubens]|uniref:hypothetical protein n=1 Tax=Streptomyces griseorubens TaxID=66897 RepID=UPI00177BA83B|nr:hypothetical protein GCM10010267_53880 [Streptomyces griseorubens]